MDATVTPYNAKLASAHLPLSRVTGMSGLVETYIDSFTYAPMGAASVSRFGNNLWEHTNFNSRLQPTQIGLGTSSVDSSKLRLDFGYGAASANNGNMMTQTIGIGATNLSQSYTYDSLNRLDSGTETGGWSQTYQFDRFGNRWVATSNVPVSPITPRVSTDYNTSTNRITSVGGRAYLHDGAGNVTQDSNNVPSANLFKYDAENRLVDYNNAAATYVYDGNGRRVKKVAGSVTTLFVYDAAGRSVAEYTTPAQAQAGGTSFLTTDHLGSTRIVTDIAATPIGRYDYYPWGEEIASSLNGRSSILGYTPAYAVRQKFTGKERDSESGLDNFGARYYGSSMGRFTSADPIFMEMHRLLDPQSLNLYSYVRNNPLSLTDPSGMLQ